MRPSSSSCSNSMAIHGPCVRAGVPRAERLEVGGPARDPPGERQLDGALDRGLAGLVGPADDRHARRQVDVELAVAAQVADLQAPDPHSETSWPASSSRPRRRASRSSAASPGPPWPPLSGAASSSAMRASRSRMNAPAIVSGDGRAPSVSAGRLTSRTRTLRNDPRQRRLDLVEMQVELVRPDADHPGVEDEVRIALLGERLDERRLRGDVGGVELDLLEPRRADLPFLDRDRASSRRSPRARRAGPCRRGPGRGRRLRGRRRRRT